LATYDDHCRAAGLDLDQRWATWDRQPFRGGDYAVSVHRSDVPSDNPSGPLSAPRFHPLSGPSSSPPSDPPTSLDRPT
ncbi:MAG: hypothetical protein QOI99_1759, partial [Actinomycetota bacterium]|nr:hypothetical protein [Actinomycetota bacterium]